MTKKKRVLILSAFILVLSISLITAAGIARPYWDDNPLKLAPGESKIVQLTLQNTDPEDMSLAATIESEIATLKDKSNEYSVPSGEINKKVNIDVEVPEDAKVGTIYKVVASFKQIASGEGGMIRMTGAFTSNFPVEVVGEQESELYTLSEKKPIELWVWALIIILVAGIAMAVIKKKQKKK